YLAEAVNDAALLRHRVFREARPGTAREFADIDIAAAVDGDAVRRGELAGRDTGMRLAEPRHDLVRFCRVDADPRANIGPIAVDLALRPTLADVAERARAACQAHAVRPVQVIPLRFPFAVAVKDLNAVVLAVGDVDPAIRVATDVMRDVELARIGAGLAPRAQQFAAEREFMEAGVAVTVRDIEEVAVGRQRGVRA